MYVIFPADEILLLSYGYAQNPRFQRRPTLDNLQETIVPSQGTRPPTNSNLDIHSNHKSFSRQSLNQLRSSITSRTSAKRDPSPNVSFADDFMNKSRSSVVEENTFRTDNSLSSGNNTLEKKKGKFKSKISKISLGKLSRPSSNEQAEPVSARLREDLEYRVTNPTFTHDNLRQKNFDAFFASGEPVYSLERKDRQLSYSSLLTPITPISPSSTIDSSSFGPPTTPTSISSERPRKNSIAALFSPKFTKQSPPANSKRPKSAELYRSAEGSVKGDRCPIQRFWWIKELFLACLCLVWSGFQFRRDFCGLEISNFYNKVNSIHRRLFIWNSDWMGLLKYCGRKFAFYLWATNMSYRKLKLNFYKTNQFLAQHASEVPWCEKHYLVG